MLDARSELHSFYDQWLSRHQELSMLLDNKDFTGLALFTAEYPHFDVYTAAIEEHTTCCHDLLRSCNSTPASTITSGAH